MSNLLNLAQDFKKKSKQQAHDTEQNLKSVFEKHERFIEEELRSSELKIRNAIDDQTENMGVFVMKSWLWILLSIVLVYAASVGAIFWQGSIISENLQIISEQKETIKQLEEKGGKIQMSRCGTEGRLCVKLDLEAGKFQGEWETEGAWMIPEGY